MNARVIPAIGINLARRCKPVLLAQLYYAERELLFCCGVLIAFLGFFMAEGLLSKLNFLFEIAKMLPMFNTFSGAFLPNFAK